MTPVDKVLGAVHGVRKTGDGWEAKCPAHDDQHASLSIGQGKDGRVLPKCQAGCKYTAVVAAAGLEVTDLFARASSMPRPRNSQPVETYTYTDQDGTPLFEVHRFEPKTFLQKLPGAANYGGLNGTKRVLYRLLELTMSDADRAVFVVEGEKDVHRLMELGLVATCNAGGAGKWRDEYSDHLAGRSVYVLPDNPGLPAKGDVSDWLGAGHSLEDLRKVVQSTPPWARSAGPLNHAGVTKAGRATLYDLGAYNPDNEAVSIDWQIDEWQVQGQIHLTVGEEKRGKSTQVWRPRLTWVPKWVDYGCRRKGRRFLGPVRAPFFMSRFAVFVDAGYLLAWGAERKVGARAPRNAINCDYAALILALITTAKPWRPARNCFASTGTTVPPLAALDFVEKLMRVAGVPYRTNPRCQRADVSRL